jgi:UPF0042 nucleotide-binding protein
MKLVIISGRSGSGKSTALHMLEDLGYYCVDNLPVGLLPEFARHAQANAEKNARSDNSAQLTAIGIDARNIGADLSRFPTLLEQIPANIKVNIIYLDANSDTLIRRFSETRRKHPLTSNSISLPEALLEEANRLDAIASMADLSIDTSAMNLHQLRELIRERVGQNFSTDIAIMFQSFGFKSNIPIDSDLVFDVRCLPNPYWDLSLRNMTGKDASIADFLESHDDVKEMSSDIATYLQNWLPRFEANNRSYLTVSIGCTGGKHRSVYIAEKLFLRFKDNYNNVQVRHRELPISG